MERLIVLDFNSGECHIYVLQDSETPEEVMEEKGHRENNCEWMVTTKEIIIH